jgi:hypothetical protein
MLCPIELIVLMINIKKMFLAWKRATTRACVILPDCSESDDRA